VSVLADLRLALRGLRRRPGMALIAVLTLAVGLGVMTAVFSLVDSALLRRLPLRDPDRLGVLWDVWKLGGQDRNKLSEPEFIDFSAQATLLQGLEAYRTTAANLTGEGAPEQVTVGWATAGLLSLLGVPPRAGRTFQHGDEITGGSHVAILSEELWKRRFGADPSIVGRNILLDSVSFEVVGVAPSWFELPGKVDLWRPLIIDRGDPSPRGAHYLTVVARLAPGAAWPRAQEQVASIAGRLRQQYPQSYPPNLGWGARLAPLRAEEVSAIRPALLLLLAAGGMVLLIACANVASLRLTAARRQVKDLALRVAFGASPWQVARQLLVESLVVAVLGGALGLLLASWGLHLLPSILPVAVAGLSAVSIDFLVLAFALAATLATGIVAGLVPALQVAKVGTHEALKEGGARASQGAGSQQLRRLLVRAETAIALLVMIGAGLVLKNLSHLESVPPGFDSRRVLTASVSLPATKYPTDEAVNSFYQQLMPRLAALPGAEAAGAVSLLPLAGKEYSGDFTVEGAPVVDDQQSNEASRRAVSYDYFRAMGIPQLAGRTFTVHDTATSDQVVIVDNDIVHQYWPQASALGRRLKLGKLTDKSPWLTVVGVVGHVKHDSLDSQSRGQMYFPLAQFSRREMSLVVRTRNDPMSLAPSLTRVVQAVDAAQPVSNLFTMDDQVRRSLFKQRLTVLLLVLFAALSASMAVVGLYAVLASSTTERVREVGIRMAMGAHRGDILGLLLGQGAAVAGVGIGIGVLVAALAAPLLASQLYRLSPYDPLVFGAAIVVLSLVTFVACFLPAWRATRIEPVTALRRE
jgi:putative ABC transport system permease protein